MCAMKVPEWVGRFFSYSVLKSSFIIDLNPVNNIPSPKIGAFQMGPKTQNGDILKNYLIKYYEEFYEEHISN
jgi:hypothetical protein